MSNNDDLSDKLKADVGKSQKDKATRREATQQRKADEREIKAARREKSPLEQERLDASNSGLTVDELRERRANPPEETQETPNLVPIDITSDDVNQTGGTWSPTTGTGIFTPAPTGAVRNNRAEPAPPSVLDNRKKRIEQGMGVSGLEEGTPTEVVDHPVHGRMEVPKDIAQAHRLYSVDFANNPRKANALAGLEGDEDFASPYMHKGGHYERLARLQAGGLDPKDISSYAKKINLTEYDTVAGLHDSLQNKKDVSTPVNYGMQHLHPEDTFIHPETGQEHPMSEWSTVHNMPLNENGLPDLTATKGTVTGVYKDAEGKMRTTVPTHIGWQKQFDQKVPQGTNPGLVKGTWRNEGPAVLQGATFSTVPQEVFNFLSNQTRQELPIGSKQSRAQIAEATRAMTAIHAASAGVTTPGRVSGRQITNPATGLPIGRVAEYGSGAISTPLTTTNNVVSQQLSGTYEQNQATSESLRDQADELDEEKESNSGFTTIKGRDMFDSRGATLPAESPSYRVDESGNPIPNPPTVGRKGNRPMYVRGRTTNAPRGARQQSLLSMFAPVHNPPIGSEGPSVTSGILPRAATADAPAQPGVEGMRGYSTPLSIPEEKTYEQPELPGFESPETPRSELESEASPISSQSPFTMTASEAKKHSRIYLEDNPTKGPAQPMLDFGAEEREEEQGRKLLAAANRGIDPTTGKRFRRSGEQWGALDPRWIGAVESSNSATVAEMTRGSNTKAAEKPRNIVPPPSGLPRGTVASGNDVEPETEAGKRIISGMRDHRSGAQFMSLLNNQNNGIIEADQDNMSNSEKLDKDKGIQGPG